MKYNGNFFKQYIMIRKIEFTLFIFFLIAGNVFAQQADDIIGNYHLPNKLKIEIFKKSDDKYYGKIISVKGYENGQTKDLKNPDKSKRNDFLLGKVIIKGLEFDKKDIQWKNGRMYGPEKGMEFNLKITGIKENEIEVIGSKYIVRQTLQWPKA